MALRAAFTVQNISINAEPVRDAVSSLLPNGGGLVQAGDYAVAQTTTPSMAVTVGVGRIWVPGTVVGNVTGTTWSTQGQYQITNDALVTLTIATANATNPRIDVVYVGMQDSQYSGSTDGPVLAVATGTPVAGATYPTNAPAIPSNSIALAWVMVAANATSIVTANITALATTAVSIPTRGVFNTTDTNWSWNGGIMKTVVPGGGLTQFTASAAMNRVAGGSFTVSTTDTLVGNFVPAGFRPPVTAYLVVSVTSAGSVVGQAQLAITTTGDFILRTFSGSFTFPSAGSMYINGSWMG